MAKVLNIRNRIIGSFLRDRRTREKLTQTKVANSLGYDSSQIVSNWERGVCAPPYEAVKRVMSLYKISKEEYIEIMTTATKAEMEVYLDD